MMEIKILKKYGEDFLVAVSIVDEMNTLTDNLEGFTDIFNLSLDETESHRIISIYETLGGQCLSAIQYDKDTGETSRLSDTYIEERFDGYLFPELVDEILDGTGGVIDRDVALLIAMLSAWKFTRSEAMRDWFSGLWATSVN